MMRVSSIISSPKSIRLVRPPSPEAPRSPSKGNLPLPSYMQSTRTFLAHLSPTKSKNLFTDSANQGDSLPPPVIRLPMPRISALPTLPGISDVTVDSDPAAEYAVVISMYEVYNDKIYDLLTPSNQKAGQAAKAIHRRALLFKQIDKLTDRKAVFGLRKVICASMKEALYVLDAGLHERRVAGTGSNSVSSRSHGFFCVEVKKRRRVLNNQSAGRWHSSALTIVDLAGSERARDAKTQGATLAEAGKINESLMYLGQCLQMQSDIGSGSTTTKTVPYRQCKLTELLFSNSFPKDGSHARAQRGTMIVAADPVGDFNATSQILRYSALAREVTVPRIPSITASLRSGAASPVAMRSHPSGSQRGGSGTHSHAPSVSSSVSDRETMELAAIEIARLSEEVEQLTDEIAMERRMREEAEAHNATFEERFGERALEVEQIVREEMYAEMESLLALEMRKMKIRWEEERERETEHVDRKLDLMAKNMEIERGHGDKENMRVMEEAEKDEQRTVRRARRADAREEGSPTKMRPPRKALAETKGFSMSPSKPSLTRDSDNGVRLATSRTATPLLEGFRDRESDLYIKKDGASERSSPMKRIRRLGTRKWEMGEEGML